MHIEESNQTKFSKQVEVEATRFIKELQFKHVGKNIERAVDEGKLNSTLIETHKNMEQKIKDSSDSEENLDQDEYKKIVVCRIWYKRTLNSSP